eukprot:7486953-Alexandrium_andersonii.AAC.1
MGHVECRRRAAALVRKGTGLWMPPAVRCAAAQEVARRAGDLRAAAAAHRAMARSERLRLE